VKREKQEQKKQEPKQEKEDKKEKTLTQSKNNHKHIEHEVLV